MSNDVLVVAEIRDGAPKKVSFEMLREGQRIAQQLSGSVQAVALGHGISDAATTLAQHGAQKIFVADDPSLENYTAEGYTNVLADLVKRTQPALVLLGATTTGKDLAPRLAARLAVGLTSDCTDFAVQNGELLVTRPI